MICLDRYEQAIVVFDQLISLDPLDPYNKNVYLDQGRVLYLLEKYSDALKAYEKCINYFGGDSNLFYNMGCMLFLLRRYSEALAAFKQVICFDNEHVRAWRRAGNTLERLGRTREALKCYKIALSISTGLCNLSMSVHPEKHRVLSD